MMDGSRDSVLVSCVTSHGRAIAIRMLTTSCLVSACSVLCVAITLSSVQAQQPTAAQIKFFETNIRPALVKYCYECHSVESGDSRGGLLVDTRQGLLQGGDAGPAIVPGDAEDSLLWEAITWQGYEMPPSQKMPAKRFDCWQNLFDIGRISRSIGHVDGG